MNASLHLKDGTTLNVTHGNDGAVYVATAGSYGDGVRWIGDNLPEKDRLLFWRGEPVLLDTFTATAKKLPYWPMPGELLSCMSGGAI